MTFCHILRRTYILRNICKGIRESRDKQALVTQTHCVSCEQGAKAKSAVSSLSRYIGQPVKENEGGAKDERSLFDRAYKYPSNVGGAQRNTGTSERIRIIVIGICASPNIRSPSSIKDRSENVVRIAPSGRTIEIYI